MTTTTTTTPDQAVELRAEVDRIVFLLDHLIRPWFSTSGPDGRFMPVDVPAERREYAGAWAADRLAELGWPSAAITPLIHAVVARRHERLSAQVHAAEAYGEVYDRHYPAVDSAIWDEARQARADVLERLAPVLEEADEKVEAAIAAGIAAAEDRA